MKPQAPEIIDYLNRVLKNELTAINQYFLHAKIFEDRGLKALAKKERHESIEEMEHADKLMERILFLEGLPNLQELGKLLIGEDTQEMLRGDLEQEMIAIPLLREAIAFAEQSSDYVTRELLEEILGNEEEHVDWLETQLELIEKTGLQNYLQSQMEGEAES
ncbi:MAG: bacterioferritin [Pseudomonadales bacterium]